MCVLGKVLEVVEIPKEKAFIGYRAWDQGLLSLSFQKPRSRWAIGKDVKSHAKPTAKNNVGLYSLKSPSARTSEGWVGDILGTVKVWGTVIIHEKGYRASCSSITRITKGKEFLDE
jgi:hypothetical protein